MKNILALALVATSTLACAAAPDGKPAAAPAAARATTPASTAQCAPPPTALVVKDITPGSGPAVRFRSAVNVGYTGWVYDGCKPDFKGAEFDSSRDRVAPFGFVVGAERVIKGWDQGLIGMKEKGKRQLVIPANLAYGDRAMAGGKIPPNSTLVFDIDLVQIVFQPGEPAAK